MPCPRGDAPEKLTTKFCRYRREGVWVHLMSRGRVLSKIAPLPLPLKNKTCTRRWSQRMSRAMTFGWLHPVGEVQTVGDP